MLTISDQPTQAKPSLLRDFNRNAGGLHFRPLSILGAEVIGLDLNQPLGKEQIVALRQALCHHKMLLIRDCELSPAEQISLTGVFGFELTTAGPNLRKMDDFPALFRISNRREEGNYNTGHYWHCDGHYLADPSTVTLMHIVEPTPDGQTLVSDLQAAYARLPDPVRRKLATVGCFVPETRVVQPIVIKHPYTMQTGLYINLSGKTCEKSGRFLPDIDACLEQHLSVPGTFYSHQWRRGDTIIVDNFAVCHKGTPADPSRTRVMHRTTVTGRGVWWRAANSFAVA